MVKRKQEQETKPRSAAIYVRISLDTEGSGAGVARQEDDCRALAERLGWTVGEVYRDNSVSAYKNKPRPEYRRMLADIADGTRDAVLIYHPDRLTRRLRDMLDFLDVVEPIRLPVRFVTGGSDLGSDDGLFVVKMMAMLAENESAAKSRRVLRKMQENAKEGKVHGGQRAYGYEADRVTIRKSEAKVIKELAKRYIAGDTMRDLTLWLQAEGVPTPKGGAWTSSQVRVILRSARIAGLREHRGEVVGPAQWKPIIKPEQRDKIIAKMETRKVAGRRAPRTYLLSGMLLCGRCEQRLYASARKRKENRARRYVCQSGPDHGGCGRLTVVADPLERWIAAQVCWRLDSQEFADARAGRAAADAEAANINKELAEDKEELEQLAQMRGRKEITMPEWLAAREPIQARIAEAQRRLARVTHTEAIDEWIGNGKALAEQWDDMPLARQSAIVANVLSHALIMPGMLGARELDTDRVKPDWRL